MKQSATTKAALPEMLFIDRSGNVPSIAHKNGKDVIHEARLYSYNGPFGEELVLRYNAHGKMREALQVAELALTDGRIGTTNMDHPAFYSTLERAAEIVKAALATGGNL